MSREDNERKAARVTIVGGQPPGNARALTGQLPVALEQLLGMAAVDETFREALLSDWRGAVEAAGLTLVPTEARILEVVEPAQLARMIEQVGRRLAGEQRRSFFSAAAAAVLALAGGAALLGSACRTAAPPPPQPTRGIRPDRPLPPPPSTQPLPSPAGMRPDRRSPIPAGIQPVSRPPQRVQPTAGMVAPPPRFSGAGASPGRLVQPRGLPNAGMGVSRSPVAAPKSDAGPPDARRRPPRPNAGVRPRRDDD